MFSLSIWGMLAVAPVKAEVIVTSDDCPVAADADPYQMESDATAEDMNPWSSLRFDDPLRVDVTVDQSPLANRVFQRFKVDPETGEAFSPAPKPCGDEAAVGQ